MDLRLRKARRKDQAEFDRVMQVISDGPVQNAEQAANLMERVAADPQKYLLVAEDLETGTLCGTLLGVVFEDICGDCRPILLIENVAVLPDYQGRGVGRAMFDEIERWGREQDCHYEMLVSGLQRTGAHKFYHALGFDEVKGFKKYL